MSHKHKTVRTDTYGWSRCVVAGCCDGRAHGGVMFARRCSCGATKLEESNGRHTASGRWVAADGSDEGGAR